jgi:hypothetical protein
MQCYAEPALKAMRRSARQRVDVHSKCNLEIFLRLIYIGKIMQLKVYLMSQFANLMVTEGVC